MSYLKRVLFTGFMLLSVVSLLLVPVDAFASSTTLKEVVLNDDAVVIKGTTLVPLAPIFKAFGAGVELIDKKTIKVTSGKKKATLTIDSKVIWVDGKKTSYPIATQVIDGKTMVPVKFASSFLGAKYTVDNGFSKLYLVGSKVEVELHYNDLYELSQQYKGKNAWVSTLKGVLSYSPTRFDSVPAANYPENFGESIVQGIRRGGNPSGWIEVKLYYKKWGTTYYYTIRERDLKSAIFLANPKVSYGISDYQWSALKSYNIILGMTKPMVSMVYGTPDRTRSFMNGYDYVDMWLYSYESSGDYTIYTFINGILSSVSH